MDRARNVNNSGRIASERGTVLLMVIGVLALLALVAIAYVTVGRSDRVTSTVSMRRQQIDDQRQAVSEYLAGVIRDDVISVYAERRGPSANSSVPSVLKREAWDYPSTDDMMRSSLGATDRDKNEYKFNPAGTYNTNVRPLTNVRDRDPRRPSDPFLASHSPSQYHLAPDLITNAMAPDPKDFVDWAHISCLAPDGRYVNLANLRGNFDVLPGMDGTNSSTYISNRLTLPNPTNPDSAATKRWDGKNLTDIDVFTSPATWSSHQMAMARPLATTLAPGNPHNPFNQYADADGDGFFDSRWFELVDAFDPASVEWYLPRNGRQRLFVAARVVDLSGMVNVNTAGDSVYEPGYVPSGAFATPSMNSALRYHPWGLTPADIDLRRLLMMSDFYFDYSGGYDKIEQPSAANNPADYSNYDDTNARVAGQAAYNALLLARTRGTRLSPTDVRGGSTPNSALLMETPLAQRNSPPAPSPQELTAKLASYDAFGADPAGASDPRDPYEQSRAGADKAVGIGYPFGIENEIQLRGFGGLSDSSAISPLEQTVDGRGGANTPLSRFGPLRSGRPLYNELVGRPDTASATGTTASDKARWLQATDVRNLITVVNGARPLANRTVLNEDLLDASELKTDVTSIRRAIAPWKTPPTGEFEVDSVDLSSITSPEVIARKDAVSRLYIGYLRALAPYRDQARWPAAWDTTATYFDPTASPIKRANTLSYGNVSAEFAARTAATMAANWTDMVDVDKKGSATDTFEPTPVLIDFEVDASANPIQPVALPSGNMRLSDAADHGVRVPIILDFPTNGSTTLPPISAPQPSRARSKQVLVYGVEPQPFLIEAAVYAVYADARDAANARSQDENSVPQTDPSFVDMPIKILWNRDSESPVPMDPTRANADYIGEMIAFQVTNPFDVTMPLVDSTNRPLFYVEYADRFYALAKFDETGLARSPISEQPTLAPHQTRTFYATSPIKYDDFKKRFEDTLLLAPGASVNVKQMMDTQFGTDSVLISMIDRETLDPNLPTDLAVSASGAQMPMADLIGDHGPTTTSGQKSVVNLWRTLRPSSSSASSRSDILIDRLRTRIPDERFLTELAAGLATLSNDVDNSHSGVELAYNATPGRDNQDNTGFAAVFWRAIRRPTAEGLNLSTHILPPWCIEPKFKGAAMGYPGSLNQYDGKLIVDADANTWDPSEGRFKECKDLVSELETSNSRFDSQIDKRAEDKTGNVMPASASMTNPGTGVRPVTYAEAAINIANVGEKGNLMMFTRAGDMLLPLAIGPSYDPSLELGSPDENLEWAWMTLSEAAALASDYWSPDPSFFGASSLGLFTGVGHEDPATMQLPVFARGQLVLDRFVPFIDLDNDGKLGSGSVTTPGDESTEEQPLGNGVPLALNVLSEFDCSDVRRAGAYGGLTRMAAGKVNVNTAPLPVLRVVPGLSPEYYESGWNSGIEPWVFQNKTPPGGGPVQHLYRPGSGSNADTFDIAATLWGYREKTDWMTRPDGPSSSTRAAIRFAEATQAELADPRQWKARRARTGIDGLREDEGLRSEGELGVLVLKNPARGAAGMSDMHNSIDRLGTDTIAMAWPGLTPLLYKSSPTVPNDADRETDNIVDGPDEKIALLNSVINTVSVRSDVFCVWFMIRGYAPEDVNNIVDDDEPMAPSLERRFMMIVDRSNVVSKADKPRVLLFKELPIE